MVRITSEANRLAVTTRCRNFDQLVTALKRYVGDDSLFIATLGEFAIGTEIAFVVTFADGATALSGTGSVRQTWSTTDNPYGVPGVLLGIDSCDDVGSALFRGMQQQRGTTLTMVPPPPPGTDNGIPQLVTSDQATTGSGPVQDRPAALIPVVRRIATPITVPILNKPRRRFFKSVPRIPTGPSAPPPTDSEPVEDDLFSTPTRPSTPLFARTPRSNWLWMGAVVVALFGGAGLVRAADMLTAQVQVRGAEQASETTQASIEPAQIPATGPTSSLPPGLCLVNFVVPAGGVVKLDGTLQKPTPRIVVTTCGWHRIDVSHPTTRATLMWWGPLIEGQPQMIDMSLAYRGTTPPKASATPPKASATPPLNAPKAPHTPVAAPAKSK